MPALTILRHPDLSRIGDRAFLAALAHGREAWLSRDRPGSVSERIVLLLQRRPPPPAAPVESFGLIGDSAGIDAVRQAIARVAPLSTPVLVRGVGFPSCRRPFRRVGTETDFRTSRTTPGRLELTPERSEVTSKARKVTSEVREMTSERGEVISEAREVTSGRGKVTSGGR